MKPFFYKDLMINHFIAMRQAAAEVGAGVQVDARTLRLNVTVRDYRCYLYPQFIKLNNGIRTHTPELGMDVILFAGWHPSPDLKWELAEDKLKFKEFLLHNALAAPAYSADPTAAMTDVVVKRRRGSTFIDIRGPFKSSCDYSLNRSIGEYYEKFVPGRIVRAWFVNAQPICLELSGFATVTGDGNSTISQLANRRLQVLNRSRHERASNVRILADFLAYYGRTLQTVLTNGEHQAIDFRYRSQFLAPQSIKSMNLRAHPNEAWCTPLKALGSRLWQAMPGREGHNAVFTVDAVLTQDSALVFLDIDLKPFIHPDVYYWVFQNLAAVERGGETQAVLSS